MSISPDGSTNSQGEGFSYMVWAATPAGRQRLSGCPGSTVKCSRPSTPMMQSWPVLGVAMVAPHSMVLPICQASAGSKPRMSGSAA